MFGPVVASFSFGHEMLIGVRYVWSVLGVGAHLQPVVHRLSIKPMLCQCALDFAMVYSALCQRIIVNYVRLKQRFAIT